MTSKIAKKTYFKAIFIVVLLLLFLAIGFVIGYQYKSVYNITLSKMKVIKNANNPVIDSVSLKKDWDLGHHVAGNCIIKDENNRTILFYYIGSKKYGSAVNYAISSDGIKFEKYANSPVLIPGGENDWDGGGVSVYPGCITQRNDGTYHMYYSGFKKGATDFYWNSLGGIGVAFSKDLIHWEKYKENPIMTNDKNIEWESEGVFEPSVIFAGDEYGSPGSYKMWYGGNNKNGQMSIGYAESINGVSWVRSKSNPVIKWSDNRNDFDAYTIEVHDVKRIGNRYILFYEATDRKFPSRFSIGLAFSNDGVSWAKSKYNPILQAGHLGSWDGFGTYHPAIVIRPDKYLLYYVGLDYSYNHQIGLAEIDPELILSGE